MCQANKEKPKYPKLRVKVCKECNEPFETYLKEKYCTPTCRIKYKARRDSK